MKLKKILTISSIFIATAAVISPVAVLVSSCTNQSQIPVVGKQEYTVNLQKNNLKSSQNLTLEMDPNSNTNAIDEGFKQLTYLSVNDWQNEFNRSLTKFFKAYELEIENGNQEIEAEIKRIKVKNSEINHNNKTINIILDATYKVESEIDDKETEELITQERKITISPMFATLTELESITAQLKSLDKNNGGNQNIDFDDLLELYVGDPDDNEKSIFEQSKIIAGQVESGGLLGMKINVSDLEYQPKRATNVSTGEMFAPLFSRPKFFSPKINYSNEITQQEFNNIKPIIDKLLLDYNKLSKITLQQFKSYFTDSTANPSLLINLNSILKTGLTSNEFNFIKTVIVDDTNNQFGGNLTITLDASYTPPVVEEKPNLLVSYNQDTNNPTNPVNKLVSINFSYLNIWFKKSK